MRKKSQHRITLRPSNSTSDSMSQRLENKDSNIVQYTNIHTALFAIAKQWKQPKGLSVAERINACSGVLLRHKKKWSTDPCCSAGAPQNQHAKRETPDTKGHMVHDSICGKELEEENPQNADGWWSEESERGNAEQLLNWCGVSSGGDEEVFEREVVVVQHRIELFTHVQKVNFRLQSFHYSKMEKPQRRALVGLAQVTCPPRPIHRDWGWDLQRHGGSPWSHMVAVGGGYSS